MIEVFRPRISKRVPSASMYAELFMAPGPNQIGVTGSNTYAELYGRNWLVLVDHEHVLRAYQEAEGGGWVEVTADLPPVFGTELPFGVRRVSLAFDQSARVIICYESAGLVRVTRWDPSTQDYIQNVTFSGRDPVAVIDAGWTLTVPGSDVVIFYLSPDRQRVCYRVQHELYAVEHGLYECAQPVILDRVLSLPWRYQLLISDAKGFPLPGLLSDVYPLPVLSELAVLAGPPAAGIYQWVVIPVAGSDAVDVQARPAAGGALRPVVVGAVGSDAVDVQARPAFAGAYRPVVIDEVDGARLDVAARPAQAGIFRLAVINAVVEVDRLRVSARGPAGGVYERA